MSEIGPQRGPSSVAKIEAERKQVLVKLKEFEELTRERWLDTACKHELDTTEGAG